MLGEAHAGLTNTESAELDFSAGIDALKEKAKASTNGAGLAGRLFGSQRVCAPPRLMMQTCGCCRQAYPMTTRSCLQQRTSSGASFT